MFRQYFLGRNQSFRKKDNLSQREDIIDLFGHGGTGAMVPCLIHNRDNERGD
ncbi:hypothetical protein B4166_3835 [Caldibacillus thermoamylovorans]|uniref:Uncharacterized protein n=1 Tax=Caldibacillus thermoamylovorans TaxID=35841 RepID=A0ABD4AB92_9BACI|nr:hypothetical protein B4166_3835 [Caldibacillus thermoamylovorans]KIO74354.1 hypothetical protein B4167_1482 [Caldibacillus thermoamylovorans]